jgi:hypothetical protein
MPIWVEILFETLAANLPTSARLEQACIHVSLVSFNLLGVVYGALNGQSNVRRSVKLTGFPANAPFYGCYFRYFQ